MINKKIISIVKDVTQLKRKIRSTPEIRVWCHPHRIDKNGDDYYYTCDNVSEALEFIKRHKEAEEYPVFALDGFEFCITQE